MVLPPRNFTSGQHSKLVHVIRHGEAQHNVDDRFLGKRNPKLTSRGHRQARALRRLVPKLKADVVLTSPGLRALQTTRSMRPSSPVVVVPDARERVSCSEHLCDLPADAIAQATSESFKDYDWSAAVDAVKKAGGPHKFEEIITRQDLKSEANIKGRARRLTKYIMTRPERRMTIVSHGAFLMRLTGDSYMGNCEVRSYVVTGDEWILRKKYYLGCHTV